MVTWNLSYRFFSFVWWFYSMKETVGYLYLQHLWFTWDLCRIFFCARFANNRTFSLRLLLTSNPWNCSKLTLPIHSQDVRVSVIYSGDSVASTQQQSLNPVVRPVGVSLFLLIPCESFIIKICLENTISGIF